ncbi:M23 family metallopeptidase [Agromyces intestinalis]|uniref:M23 family metallopeptidase n=2 Tax=Agromyces intestinalis TaxID=2592652 RepID=A0A5C1YMJ1_9MICO|nr:M23 family metallopeptidase [Agromyces intestinalis]
MGAAAASAAAVTPPATPLSTGSLGPSIDPGWVWPVEPPIFVAQAFRAPATPYSSGHRGIDLTVAPGAVVAAPADGVVVFAGMVAGREVVTIDHGHGVLSSYEPIEASVEVGLAVHAGDPIGSVATGGHCDDECLHLGVRIDGEYVSPFRFLGGVPSAVLLPWRD